MPATAEAVTARPAAEFVSCSEAARASGLSYYAVQKLAILGQVRTRSLPGSSIKYHRGDVARCQESEPATARPRKGNGARRADQGTQQQD